MSRAEALVVGFFVAIYAAAQVVLLCGAVGLVVALAAGWRGELPLNFELVLLVVIIGIGLYFPLVAVTMGLGDDALTEDDKRRWGRRFRRFGAVALFAFWWRYHRPTRPSSQSTVRDPRTGV